MMTVEEFDAVEMIKELYVKREPGISPLKDLYVWQNRVRINQHPSPETRKAVQDLLQKGEEAFKKSARREAVEAVDLCVAELAIRNPFEGEFFWNAEFSSFIYSRDKYWREIYANTLSTYIENEMLSGLYDPDLKGESMKLSVLIIPLMCSLEKANSIHAEGFQSIQNSRRSPDRISETSDQGDNTLCCHIVFKENLVTRADRTGTNAPKKLAKYLEEHIVGQKSVPLTDNIHYYFIKIPLCSGGIDRHGAYQPRKTQLGSICMIVKTTKCQIEIDLQNYIRGCLESFMKEIESTIFNTLELWVQRDDSFSAGIRYQAETWQHDILPKLTYVLRQPDLSIYSRVMLEDLAIWFHSFSIRHDVGFPSQSMESTKRALKSIITIRDNITETLNERVDTAIILACRRISDNFKPKDPSFVRDDMRLRIEIRKWLDEAGTIGVLDKLRIAKFTVDDVPRKFRTDMNEVDFLFLFTEAMWQAMHHALIAYRHVEENERKESSGAPQDQAVSLRKTEPFVKWSFENDSDNDWFVIRNYSPFTCNQPDNIETSHDLRMAHISNLFTRKCKPPAPEGNTQWWTVYIGLRRLG